MQIGAPLTEAVHKAVNTLGLTCKVTPAAEADIDQHDIDSKSTASKTQLQHQVANSTTQNAAAPVAKSDKAKVVTKAVKQSGDDLGDEFDIEVDAAEDEGSKKQQKNSSVASDLSLRQTPKIKSKKPRVVEF